jgi:glucose dehydrogenase
MMTAIQNFILVFDRRAGELVAKIEFGTHVKAAVDEYERLEEKHRNEPHMDIVLVGSDSIETVQITHANYFNGKARDVYADILSIAN